MTAAVEQVKAWALPLALGIIGALGLMLWNNQQEVIRKQSERINSLETTIATVTENQRQGAADRQSFQDATTARLDQMQDVLVRLGLNIERLTVLQEERAER